MRAHSTILAVLATLAAGLAGGPLQASAAASEPATAPAVSTGQASGVTQEGATLTGTLDTEGHETTYEFDIGVDTSYGTRIFGDAGVELGTQTFTAPLLGLAPDTTYHYRILATNAFGTTYGADQAFTTAGYPSAAIAAPATLPLVPTPLLAEASTTSAPKATSTKASGHAPRKRSKAKKSNGKAGGHKRKVGSGGSGRAHRANTGGGK
jgi:hypothetical protein